MEITINHVITLSPEVKDFLTLLVGKAKSFETPAVIAGSAISGTKEKIKAPKKEPVSIEPAQVAAEPAPIVVRVPEPVATIEQEINPVPTVETSAPVIKMEDLRARAIGIAKAGKRDEVKKAIAECGAENVPSMDPARYAELSAKLDLL